MFAHPHGALLVNKHAGVSSFGVIEELQRQLQAAHGVKRKDLQKLGHGGTLDPFATGLLIVCSGNAVKLARYFLGSIKTYECVIRFGETTIPGDPTAPISERSDVLPKSREQIQEIATQLTRQLYLQTPPMHSAKKVGGKPLYELARQGKEIEREPRACRLHEFEVIEFQPGDADAGTLPRARCRVRCSAGTYIRTLAQDLGKLLGTVAMLDTLNRTASGMFRLENACTTEQIKLVTAEKTKRWDELPCWLPFDRLLESYDRAEATPEEAQLLFQGRQQALIGILKRTVPSPHRLPGGDADVDLHSADLDADGYVAIYSQGALIAVARTDQGVWSLERVFVPGTD